MRIPVVALLTLVACGSKLVPIVPDGAGAGASAAPNDPTFEVVARTVGVKDPLPVNGAGVSYGELETALAQAILRAVKPHHDSVLTIELVGAEADYARERLSVSFVVRATLRAKNGNAFIGQTQAVCRDGEIIAPERGATVVWSCMTRLGQDIGGWL